MAPWRILSYAFIIVLVELSYHIYYERTKFSLVNGIFRFDKTGIKEIMNLKLIFLLLFFEHQYLNYYPHY